MSIDVAVDVPGTCSRGVAQFIVRRRTLSCTKYPWLWVRVDAAALVLSILPSLGNYIIQASAMYLTHYSYPGVIVSRGGCRNRHGAVER